MVSFLTHCLTCSKLFVFFFLNGTEFVFLPLHIQVLICYDSVATPRTQVNTGPDIPVCYCRVAWSHWSHYSNIQAVRQGMREQIYTQSTTRNTTGKEKIRLKRRILSLHSCLSVRSHLNSGICQAMHFCLSASCQSTAPLASCLNGFAV